MSELSNAAGILNTIMIILVLVGGYIALRSGKNQKTGEIQGQVIEALKAELESLQRRLETLEKENTRLTQIMNIIRAALRKRGLVVSIESDIVIISDHTGSSSTSTTIQQSASENA